MRAWLIRQRNRAVCWLCKHAVAKKWIILSWADFRPNLFTPGEIREQAGRIIERFNASLPEYKPAFSLNPMWWQEEKTQQVLEEEGHV